MVAPTKRLNVDSLADGTLLNTTNTDLNSIVPAGTGSATAQSGSALRGSKGVRVTGAAGDTYALQYTGAAAASASAQVYFRSAGNPTVNNEFFGIRSGSGNMGRIVETTAGLLQLQNGAGVAVAWSGGPFTRTAGVKYRCQVQVTKGTTTSDGTLSAQIYDDTDTLVRSASTSTTNTGTADATTARCGKVVSASAGVDMDLDEFAFITGTTAEIDAVSANTPPSAGADQTADAYQVVTLSAVDAEGGGGWAQTGGSPTVALTGSGQVRTFEAPAVRAGTTLTFTYTDGGGLTDAMSVVVYPHSEYAVDGTGAEVPARFVAV